MKSEARGRFRCETQADGSVVEAGPFEVSGVGQGLMNALAHAVEQRQKTKDLVFLPGKKDSLFMSDSLLIVDRSYRCPSPLSSRRRDLQDEKRLDFGHRNGYTWTVRKREKTMGKP